MNKSESHIWYDGELVPWAAATTHVLTHSLHYGVAVFEGVRAYATETGAALFRLAEHTRRLLASAKLYGLHIPYDEAALMEAQCAAVRANGLEAGYVRAIAFYGAEKLGVSPHGARVHVAVAAFPWQAYLGPEAHERGVRVKTSSYTRAPARAGLPRAKVSALYANSMLAHEEARQDGYDEALLLDGAGMVAEGAGENIFIVKGGCLYEPEPTSAFYGITRDVVHALARERGWTVQSRPMLRDDVYLADEAFFCGTAAEITPIVELDRKPISNRRPGPLTVQLMKAYRDLTAYRVPEYHHWLTHVEAKAVNSRGPTSAAGR